MTPAERAELKAWVERERGASLRTLLVELRTVRGFPLDEHEWLLVQAGHAAGWHGGLDAALRGGFVR